MNSSTVLESSYFYLNAAILVGVVLFAVVEFGSGEAQPSDAALMARVASRDASALEDLYDRYSRPVYSLVVRILQQAATAEEVVQDIFLQLWRNASRYEPSRGPLEPWLLTMARYRALDTLRLKGQKQRLREDEIGERQIVCAAPNPEVLLDQETRAARVRTVMSALPEQQRRAIELAFFEGMSHSEISAAMSEPLGTVKSWIRNGLLRLRQELEPAT